MRKEIFTIDHEIQINEDTILEKGDKIQILKEAIQLVNTPVTGTKSGWTVDFSKGFQFMPLTKDVTLEQVVDFRDYTFKKGDLVSNLPGGVFIKVLGEIPEDFETMVDRYDNRWGKRIKKTKKNMTILAGSI